MQHILITGASSGIGAALAREYAGPNTRLALTGRNKARLERVAKACRDKGAEVNQKIIDVRDRESMQDWLKAQDKECPLDLVIANAGISGGTGGTDSLIEAPAQIRDIFAVNWAGVMNTVNPVLPIMIRRGSGQIALMSSLAGFRGFPGAASYCASKAAVKTYGEGLRTALKESGVKVSIVCPGFVESAMTAKNDYKMPFIMSAERAARIVKKKLDKNKALIVFPYKAFIFAWLLSIMPNVLAEYVLKSAPKKPAAKTKG